MKLGAVLFLMGLPGIVLLGLFIIPAMLQFAPEKPTISTQVLIAITIVQSSIFLLLALWAGGALSSKVGLEAPIVSSLTTGKTPSFGFSGPSSMASSEECWERSSCLSPPVMLQRQSPASRPNFLRPCPSECSTGE